MIKMLNNHDKITINVFGEEKKAEVFSTDYFYSGENRNGLLRENELACLNWLIENVKIIDYEREILDWCNEQYEMIGEKSITEDRLKEEVFITAIAINVTGLPQSGDGSVVYPEISFFGECECEPEHGICIGFRDKKFLGIDVQSWTL